MIGGRLEIDSPKRGGTCVSCYFPDNTLKPNKPNKKQNGQEAIPGKNHESISRIDLNFLHRSNLASGDIFNSET